MKFTFVPFAVLVTALVIAVQSLDAQTDKETDDTIKQASEAAAKMGVEMPDVKKQLADIEQDEAKEKAALQKQLEAPGPVALPDWTPKTPQFAPAGPASKKIVDDQVNIIVTGTSPLTPAELGDAWEAVKTDKVTFGRSNNSINDTKTVIIYLRTHEEPQQEVRMEATRAPDEKITHITISSPLPKPEETDE